MRTQNVVLAIVAIPLLGNMAKSRKESLPVTQADSLAIREAIERGARGFMRGNPDSILAHYAPDVILSYPGIPDQDYATLARGYAELRNRPSNVTAETRPSFDEILVSGSLAVVRLRWTTTIRVAPADGPARETVRRLRDLQVWRRESTGDWHFVRGMHYADSSATSALPPRAQEPIPSLLGRQPGSFVAISVGNIDAQVAWYRDTLGFTVMNQGTAPNGIAKFALLNQNSALLELIQHREGRPRSVAAPETRDAHQIHGFFKGGFVIDDIDRAYRTLTSKGVRFAYALGEAGETPYRSFGVRDPENNLLQFFGR